MNHTTLSNNQDIDIFLIAMLSLLGTTAGGACVCLILSCIDGAILEKKRRDEIIKRRQIKILSF